ncbi:PH domain-containing protein [Streptomyces ovatisporus]|uniref:PH domain-containing protein n=1 Tax=Streptomyces ovatisporus TaxID=1128682 RepID=A0ABV9A0P4_9ACTN
MSSESRPEREPEQGREPDAASASGPAPASEAEPGGEAAPDAAATPGSAAAAEPGTPAYADRCYRSPAALAGGVMLLLLAGWLGTDALLHGVTRTRLIALAGLLLVVPLVVAFTLRPAVYANPQRMRVRNPFRTITVPWGTVESLQSGYSSEVVADGTKYQLWSIPVSLRARKRAARQTERAERAASRSSGPARPTGFLGLGGVPGGEDDATGKRAPSDQAIDELRALALENGESSTAQGEVTVRWAYEIAAPALAGGVALAVLLGLL